MFNSDNVIRKTIFMQRHFTNSKINRKWKRRAKRKFHRLDSMAIADGLDQEAEEFYDLNGWSIKEKI